MLSRNSRSGKIHQIAQQNNWQYQEFVDFSEHIKEANFGIINYSQNAIFRHFISADDSPHDLSFNFFDCRALEPMGMHNSSLILFNLKLATEFQNLHLFIKRQKQAKDAFSDISNQQSLQQRYQQQKLIALAQHQVPNNLSTLKPSAKAEVIYANQPSLAYQLLQGISAPKNEEKALTHWLLAYPNLHIEISNGILLVYQENHLIEEDSIMQAIAVVAELAQLLSQSNIR